MLYRKKPIVVEAWQLTEYAEFPDWILERDDIRVKVTGQVRRISMLIPTLEGEMTACIGDWIIKGISGELYPCKPDIFAATYEPVSASPVNNTLRMRY